MANILWSRVAVYSLTLGLGVIVGWGLSAVLRSSRAPDVRASNTSIPPAAHGDSSTGFAFPNVESTLVSNRPAENDRQFESVEPQPAAFPSFGEPVSEGFSSWSGEQLVELAQSAVPEAVAVQFECEVPPCRVVVIVDRTRGDGLHDTLERHFHDLNPAYLDVDVGYARASTGSTENAGMLAVITIHDEALTDEQKRFAEAAATMTRFGLGDRLLGQLIMEEYSE